MTLTNHLASLPPFVCRLLAKKKGESGFDPLTNRDIAERSGLSLRSVIRLSRKTSWAGTKIGVADRYLKACGIDPMCVAKHAGQCRRILCSRNGFEGTRHLHRSRKLKLWVKAARARYLRKLSLADVLEE